MNIEEINTNSKHDWKLMRNTRGSNFYIQSNTYSRAQLYNYWNDNIHNII